MSYKSQKNSTIETNTLNKANVCTFKYIIVILKWNLG